MYVINLNKYKLVGTHWITLHVNGKDATYLDSFRFEQIPKGTKNLIWNRSIITNIFIIQACDSII